jgi:hypothetical protein
MLYALVDWENREVARVGQATGTVELLQTAQHLGAAIALGKNAVYPVWPRQVQHRLRHLGFVTQQRLGGGGAKPVSDRRGR